MQKRNIAKVLIVLVLAILAFFSPASAQAPVAPVVAQVQSVAASNDCTSLADETGEQVSLWDALAAHHNVDPTSWDVKTFRKYAAVYATSVGLVYDKSANGNIAIVHSLLCAKTNVTKNGRYADDQFDNGITVFYTYQNGVVVDTDTVLHSNASTDLNVDTTSNVVTTLESVNALDSVTLHNVASSSPLFAPLAGVHNIDVVGPTCDSQVTVDTVYAVDTVEATFCDCSSSRSLAELWEDYMHRLPKAIRKEKDAGQRALLAGCREKIGRIVRSEHRYGGRLIDDTTNVRDVLPTRESKRGLSASPILELPVEFCGLTSNIFLGVKAAERNIEAVERAVKRAKVKRSNDLARAKAKRGWRNFVFWLKRTFGSPCRK